MSKSKSKKSKASAPSEEMKARFRAALDAKQSHAGVADGSETGGSPSHAAGSGPAKSTQMFRRKAGG